MGPFVEGQISWSLGLSACLCLVTSSRLAERPAGACLNEHNQPNQNQPAKPTAVVAPLVRAHDGAAAGPPPEAKAGSPQADMTSKRGGPGCSTISARVMNISPSTARVLTGYSACRIQLPTDARGERLISLAMLLLSTVYMCMHCSVLSVPFTRFRSSTVQVCV